jgi:hypothetical protein
MRFERLAECEGRFFQNDNEKKHARHDVIVLAD